MVSFLREKNIRVIPCKSVVIYFLSRSHGVFLKKKGQAGMLVLQKKRSRGFRRAGTFFLTVAKYYSAAGASSFFSSGWFSETSSTERSTEISA